MTDQAKSHHYRVESIHSYNIDVPNRELFLFGEEGLGDEDNVEPGVEFTMANRFIRNIRMLSLRDKRPILVHMKTCGGDWHEGMAIYDAIKHCPAHVTILSYTHARSMSSIILQAADRRVLMPHSTFMFHEGSFGMFGTWKQVKTAVDFVRRTEDQQMLDVYVDSMQYSGIHRQKSREDIAKLLKMKMDESEEVYMTAEETVAWGLADEVFAGWSTL